MLLTLFAIYLLVWLCIAIYKLVPGVGLALLLVILLPLSPFIVAYQQRNLRPRLAKYLATIYTANLLLWSFFFFIVR
jgi:hypothetical protein